MRPTLWQRIGNSWHYWFVALLPVLFHFPLVSPIGGVTGEGDDFYTLHCASRIICADAAQHGRLPEWTDGLFNGFPIFSASETAFFFPSNLALQLAGWFPDTQNKADLYMLGHFIFLALATAFCARGFKMSRAAAVLTSIICCYNGYFAHHTGHINLLQTIACGFMGAGLLLRMPLIGGRATWRFAVGAGLFTGAGILPGHSQTVLYMHYTIVFGVIIGAILVWRRDHDWRKPVRLLFMGAFAVTLGICFAAVQFFPTVKLLSVCERLDQSREAAWIFGGDIRQIASFLLPNLYREMPWDLHAPYFYRPVSFQWFGSAAYERLYPYGLTAFLMGLVGYISNFRRPLAQVLFWISLFLVGCSFGTEPTLYGILYNYLPGVSAVRVPTRLLWISFSLWAILAGFGFDALFTQVYRPVVRVIAKRSLAVIGGLVLSVAVILIVASVLTGGWLNAAVDLLVIDSEPAILPLVQANIPVFVWAIFKQSVVAAAILVSIVVLIIVAGFVRASTFRAIASAALIAVLVIELFLYTFAITYSPYRAAGNGFPKNAFTALGPVQPAGRVHTPGVYHSVGTINLAAVTGPKLATGYCATVPNWIMAFWPWVIPPWRPVLDNALLDLACVSDIIMPAYTKRLRIEGKTVRFADAYSVVAQPTSATGDTMRHPPTIVFATGTTEPVTAIHVLGATGGSIEFPNDTKVGDVETLDGTTTRNPSFALVLGRNISDREYEGAQTTKTKPLHSVAKLAFKQRSDVVFDFAPLRNVSDAVFKFDAPTPVTEIRITATHDPIDLFISQVLLETSSGIKVLLPPADDEFKVARSYDPRWLVLRRKNPPPIARMVPTAQLVSYRKMRNVTARLTSTDYRMDRDIFVNREEYTSAALDKLNASEPGNFSGSAKLLPTDNPARVAVQTTSNQPGWLFLSQSWYEGWTATIDDKPAKLSRINGAYTGLAVPEGSHTVRLSFRTPWLLTGAIVSSLAVLLSAVILIPSRRNRYGQTA